MVSCTGLLALLQKPLSQSNKYTSLIIATFPVCGSNPNPTVYKISANVSDRSPSASHFHSWQCSFDLKRRFYTPYIIVIGVAGTVKASHSRSAFKFYFPICICGVKCRAHTEMAVRRCTHVRATACRHLNTVFTCLPNMEKYSWQRLDKDKRCQECDLKWRNAFQWVRLPK